MLTIVEWIFGWQTNNQKILGWKINNQRRSTLNKAFKKVLNFNFKWTGPEIYLARHYYHYLEFGVLKGCKNGSSGIRSEKFRTGWKVDQAWEASAFCHQFQTLRGIILPALSKAERKTFIQTANCNSDLAVVLVMFQVDELGDNTPPKQPSWNYHHQFVCSTAYSS